MENYIYEANRKFKFETKIGINNLVLTPISVSSIGAKEHHSIIYQYLPN